MKLEVPRDMFGQEIKEGDIVTVALPFPLTFRVAAVGAGGMMTPQGQAPSLVRLVADFTLRKFPGKPFMEMGLMRNPQAQVLLESLADNIAES